MLIQHGIDAQRVNALVSAEGVAIEGTGLIFKKIEAETESPENFGLLVRRVPLPAPAPH